MELKSEEVKVAMFDGSLDEESMVSATWMDEKLKVEETERMKDETKVQGKVVVKERWSEDYLAVQKAGDEASSSVELTAQSSAMKSALDKASLSVE